MLGPPSQSSHFFQIVRGKSSRVDAYVVGGIVSPRLPLIAVQDGFAVGAGARAAAPLGLLQRWTRWSAAPRFYRDLPRPLRLTYPAATTARAPRAPLSHFAVPRRAWNHGTWHGYRFPVSKRFTFFPKTFLISIETNNGPHIRITFLFLWNFDNWFSGEEKVENRHDDRDYIFGSRLIQELFYLLFTILF